MEEPGVISLGLRLELEGVGRQPHPDIGLGHPSDVRGDVRPAMTVGLIPSGPGFHAGQLASKEIAAALVGR